MRFEDLANEILVDIFEYFDVITLFHIFLNLNNRLNRLIFNKQYRISLNFDSIKKHDFEQFCQQHLSQIINQVTSLHLSDDTETPNLPRLLSENGFSIHRFYHLHSLTLDINDTFQLINEITFQTRELVYLTHLNIKFKSDSPIEGNINDLIDMIWSLPKLTVCHLNVNCPYVMFSTNMSTVSNSIEILSTMNITHSSFTLPILFQHTPNLRTLHLGKFEQYDELPKEMICPLKLKSFTVDIESSIELMIDLFHKLPLLTSLTLLISKFPIDGQQLEQILQTYFPNLHQFHCQITIDLSSSNDLQQIINSFRSDYWTKDHQWFIRCDWNSNDKSQPALLYTLPYAFDTFNYIDGYCCSQTTSSDDLNSSNFYQKVHRLYYRNHRTSMQFTNIRHLTIKLPLNDEFWSIISRFDKLTHLTVTLSRNLSFYQLQKILDRACQLYSLRLYYLNNFTMASLTITSSSIRRLELLHEFGYQTECFTNEDYMILARSCLGSQCEVLKIDINNTDNITTLVQNMPHLRALSVQSKKTFTNFPSSIFFSYH